MNAEILKGLKFQFPFRKYQNLIIQNVLDSMDKETKFHIVAPPGSGKTIVGIELIKIFGSPAVVFSPTSTIQLQWKEKVKMFIPEDSNFHIDEIAGIDAKNLKPINAFTYQLISTSAENDEFIEEAAILNWKEDLTGQGISASLEEAENRIKLLRKNNPGSYKQELRKYYKKLKDLYLRDPNFDGTKLLHPNARKLIDDLVKAQVRVVIMDESHHLLDYWAMVIKTLLKSLDNPILIGLTATPPLSSEEEELENYLSIMGEIDFEIPTPAVVKEGNLAPYQDLVYFCNPTPEEKKFINNIQNSFQQVITEITGSDTFLSWIIARMLGRNIEGKGKQTWTAFFNSHTYLAIAGIKYLEQVLDHDIPREVVEIEEMKEEIKLEDWIYLLADYSLNFLKLSSQEDHHKQLRNIKAVLQNFGFVLSEKGIRMQRSITDRILALSENKTNSTVKILGEEYKSMGDRLRSIVITDFEKESAISKKIGKTILDEESGSAVKVYRKIAEDQETTKLEPILVTGSTVLMEKHVSEDLLKAMNSWIKKTGAQVRITTVATPYAGIVELKGAGADWRTNTYVRMITDIFEDGYTKCLVGTRGILGEGWDSIGLNTLIDLTSATTSMTVNQIRGRSIRLDPKNSEKLANNWDVVCVDPDFDKGDQDFLRFVKKQSRFYGLGAKGKIIKGTQHVDEQLAFEYSAIGFKRILFRLVNERMLSKARARDLAYKAWEIGNPYSNFEYSATKIDARDLKFKTVFTLRDSLKAIIRNLLIGFGAAVFWYLYIFNDALMIVNNSLVIFILGIIFVVTVLIFTGKNAVKYFRKAFIELPLDSYLLDIGKSLLKSLRETGLISANQSVDNVRVVIDEFRQYDVYLDYAAAADSQLFSRCMRELLAPVTNQRYLVSRSEDNIRAGFYTPIWWLFRKISRAFSQERIAYHPVPAVLSVNKDRAEIFAGNWSEYVGGGRLIYTRSEEGTVILLKLRKFNKHRIKKMNFEVWK